jgi:hypothetical protein
MQTKAGRVAKAPTAEEIRDILSQASAKLRDLQQDGKWPADWEPIWSMDRVPIHRTAAKDWDHGQWRKDRQVMGTPLFVPTYSPDLHQVIEHVHANTVRAWKTDLLLEEPRKQEYENAVAMYKHLETTFYNSILPVSIQANVEKLLDRTYPEVLRLRGDWPTHEFR